MISFFVFIVLLLIINESSELFPTDQIKTKKNYLIREFNNYTWKLNGAIPIDKFNHAIDASRYAIQYLLTRSVPHGNYFIR